MKFSPILKLNFHSISKSSKLHSPLTWEIGKAVSCCNVLLIKAKQSIKVTSIPTISFQI